MNTQLTKKQQGFSLVELALALAVLTILILAVSMSSGIRDNARVQSAARSIEALRSAAENYLAVGRVSYEGMSAEVLKTAKMLPDNFTTSKTNPWGGDFSIAANSENITHYDITLNGLTKADADKLSAYFNNSANEIAFDDSSSTWSVTF